MVKILHLYPNLMNLYGEYGNILVLKKHLEDQGMKVSVDKKDIEDKIDFSKYDFVYMGSGTESSLAIARFNILKYKNDIYNYIRKNKVLLFTGNAMELLGKSINNKEALGLFDFESNETDKRYTGDVIVRNDDLGEIVGFINKSTLIKGSEKNKLFDYVFVDKNLKDNTFEGYHINNIYGTHIIGPILVKNPKFIEKIVMLLLPNNHKYKKLNYKYEELIYSTTLEALKKRK